MVEKVNMKMEKEYNSFIMNVPRGKMSCFMDPRLWPDGICYRRYIDFKNRQKGPAEAQMQNTLSQ